MHDPVIEARGLRMRYGAKVAVADLSLTVRRGEVFGYLGPNGAGKTTALKMLLGLVTPTAGSGRVLGAPLGDRRARAGLGFLPEHFRFQDWLTGRELLRYHGRLVGRGGAALESRCEDLLARVDLLDAADRPIRTYSKGMTQRLGLAQALLNDPEVVFLDEPTSGLDPLGRILVRDVIHELRAGGTTVFLNSHLLGEVEATCTRVVFVKDGRTAGAMALDDSDTALEVASRTGPWPPGTRVALAAIGGVLEVAEPDGAAGAASPPAATGGAVTTRMRVAEEAVLPEVARLLVERGVRVYEIRIARKSLEQWFLEIVGREQGPG